MTSHPCRFEGSDRAEIIKRHAPGVARRLSDRPQKSRAPSLVRHAGAHVTTSLKKEFSYSCITFSCVENKVGWGILYAQLRQFEPRLFGAIHRLPFSACMVAIAATACGKKQ